MSYNTFGRMLQVTTFGESHGPAIGCVIDGFPPGLFIESFEEARRAGLRTVAHAGEAAGPESIWGAIDELRVERIGHGVRCIEDPVLVETLRERRIPLEGCPVSNYRLGIVKAGEMHPVREMLDAGLHCCINSDDPAMFSTSLVNEYETLASMGFGEEELLQFNRNALSSSFMTDAEKDSHDIPLLTSREP